MVAEHRAMNKQVFELMKTLKVKLTESDTSRSLRGSGKDRLVKLKELKGDAFDKAYADAEVGHHQQMLDTIDKDLIPSAQSAGLKDLLARIQPAAAARLETAKTLRSSLAGKQP